MIAIRTQLIVSPRLIRTNPLLHVGFAAATLFNLALLGKYPGLASIFIIVCVLIMMVWILVCQRSKYAGLVEVTGLAVQGFANFIGSTPDFVNAYVYAIGGNRSYLAATGLAVMDGSVFIMENGVAAEIPWQRIRSWYWSKSGDSQTNVYSLNSGNVISSHVEERSARASARGKSGFFVQVSDIEKPIWHFTCSHERSLRKWEEIFLRIGEGSPDPDNTDSLRTFA